ncbi:transposase [Acetobacter sp. DsW_063]|uniref:transposase n=1 Tax=Acetobacter sp. DsW_063 TaxID=1514894 RepID=UPI000B6B01E1|nr:transposase [Acetobacter sp. DsW_063]OUJ17075.1 hypothetical protein HK28_07860 [Acetobacter sp. DsW_063]
MCGRYQRVASDAVAFWLSDEQLDEVMIALPTARRRRLDERAVVSAIVHVLRTGMMWRDLPADYGLPWRRVYNSFVRWSLDGAMDRVLSRLFDRETRNLVVNADDILRHPTGEFWAERGCFQAVLSVQ